MGIWSSHPNPKLFNSWFLFDLLSNWVIKRQYENHMYNAHCVFFSYINTMGESQCRDTGPTSGLLWSLPGTLGKSASMWIIFEESDQKKKYRVSEPGISWACMSKVQCPKQFSFLIHFAFCVTLLFPKSSKWKGMCSVWPKL